MKNRLALLSLVVLVMIASMLSLGADTCSQGSDSGKIGILRLIRTSSTGETRLELLIRPTGSAQANHVYQVDLYEKRSFKASSTVSWNQPNIDVKQAVPVYFALSQEEWQEYHLVPDKKLRKTFSIKVHE